MQVPPAFASTSVPNIQQTGRPESAFTVTYAQNLNSVAPSANHTTNVVYANKRFRNDSQSGLTAGQFAFAMKETIALANSTGLYTVVNLPSLNYYLAKKTIDDPELTPHELKDEYAFLGVVVTGPHDVRAKRQTIARAMRITTTTEGVATTVANVFGRVVLPGERLYLIWKHVSFTHDLTYDLNPAGRTETVYKKFDVDVQAGMGSTVRTIVQVIPFVSTTFPSFNDLAYTDINGHVRMGTYTVVGRVEDSYSNSYQQATPRDEQYANNASRSPVDTITPCMLSYQQCNSSKTFSVFVK